ncbi:MAG: hypothetical protein AAGA48_01800 [Myxococcota bacterium]
MIFWSAAALAGPLVDADPYQPTLDASAFATIDTAADAPTMVTAQSSWAVAPIRAVDDTGALIPVIRHAWGLHVGARHPIGPVRLGGTATVYPVRIGTDEPTVLTVVGDPTLEAVVSGTLGQVRLGAIGRLGASLGAAEQQLGHPGGFGDLGLLAAWEGPVTLATNLGIRLTPTQTLVDVDFDDALWIRVGLALPLHPRWDVTTEAVGSVPRRGTTPDTAPFEVLLSTRYRLSRDVALHGGLGRGVSPGIGAPAIRLFLGLRFALPRNEHAVGT